MIEKGKISALLFGGAKATVIPSFSSAVVSHELVVPFFLLGCLSVGMEVVYCSFADNTGVVLARADGEWNHTITGDVAVSGTLQGGRVTDGAVTLGTHTHTVSSFGESSAGHG